MLLSRKMIFGLTEVFVGVLLLLWIIFTVAYFSEGFSISGFPKVNLIIETASENRISTIAGLSTIAEVGAVLIFISSALLIIYFGTMILLYWIKINKTITLYLNMVLYSISACGLITGILFVCLDL